MISSIFKEKVKNNNILAIKIMLKDSMLVDKSLKTFYKLEAYAKENLKSLYDAHDGEVLNNDSFYWTESYLDKQMLRVIDNFSIERVELLKKIIKYIYRESSNINLNNQNSNKNLKFIKSKPKFSKRSIGTVLVIAGSVLSLAGLISSKKLLIAGVITIGAGVIIIKGEN